MIRKFEQGFAKSFGLAVEPNTASSSQPATLFSTTHALIHSYVQYKRDLRVQQLWFRYMAFLELSVYCYCSGHIVRHILLQHILARCQRAWMKIGILGNCDENGTESDCAAAACI